MPRHGSLAEQLKALLAYRSRPEGKPEPVKSNWKTIAANDNNPEDLADKRIERRWSVRPTLDEIMAAVKDGETVCNEDGQITAIGKLRFSDGTQTEQAYKRGLDGKLIRYDAPMPVGAMLGTRDRQERMLGGDESASNRGYRDVYGARHSGKAKRKSKEARAKEKPAPQRSKSEMRAEIANAGAPVTVCPAGFPWQPAKLRELFMGLEKGKKGESGLIAWEDISTHIVEREVWEETMAALASKDKATLDRAMTAKNLSAIGELHGFVGKRAERMGKQILRAANDNLSGELKKSVA